MAAGWSPCFNLSVELLLRVLQGLRVHLDANRCRYHNPFVSSIRLYGKTLHVGAPAVEPGGSAGLYRVRVGRFESRAEAEQVSVKLRDVEKFKPYITQ